MDRKEEQKRKKWKKKSDEFEDAEMIWWGELWRDTEREREREKKKTGKREEESGRERPSFGVQSSITDHHNLVFILSLSGLLRS